MTMRDTIQVVEVGGQSAAVAQLAANRAVAAAEAAEAAQGASAGDRAAIEAVGQQVAADRVQTGQDRTATGEDRAAVAQDRGQAEAAAAAADADRQQTWVDVLSSTSNASAAYQSMLTALAQAGLASTMAASAASVAQQDLSGTTLAALHRSPNAVVAAILYDTSRDSDGGAWVEKCADKSWARETLMGTWLGQHASEVDARDYFGALGAASIVTGDSSTFTNGVGAWIPLIAGTVVTSVSGRLRLACTVNGQQGADIAVATTPGQRYRLSVTNTRHPGKNSFIAVGTARSGSDLGIATLRNVDEATPFSFVASGATTYLRITTGTNAVAGDIYEFDDFTVTPVDLSKNPSGAYYQSTVDGKFYRLWKNVFSHSEFPSGTGNLGSFGALVSSATMSGYDGAVAMGWNGTDNQTAYKTVSTAYQGMQALISVVVEMDDGNPPVFGNASVTNAANDFALVLAGTAVTSPNTNYQVEHLGGSRYRVSGIGTVGAVSAFGVIKYGTNSSRTFKTTGWHLEPYGTDRANAAYEKKAVADLGQSETFRGNKAKFPRLAAIVAEASRVVIYDLLEPGRPMWMVVTMTASAVAPYNQLWRNGGRNATSLAARESELCIGLSATVGDSAAGVIRINFAKDVMARQGLDGSSPAASGVFREGVAQRTSTTLSLPTPLPVLASSQINAVAMMVRPQAPVDPVTGLQVPTIAVAVGSGSAGNAGSVVMDDGAVVNYTQPSNDGPAVAFTARGEIVWGLSASTGVFVMPLASANVAIGSSRAYGGSTIVNVGNSSSKKTVGASTLAAFGRSSLDGKVNLLRENPSSMNSGLAATIHNAYNTGWMVGDIRRAWAAEVSSGVVSGANQITNGTFDGDNIEGWSQLQGSVTGVGGRLRVQAAGGTLGRTAWALTCVPNKSYRITMDRFGVSTTANIIVTTQPSSVAGAIATWSGQSGTALAATYEFVATQASHWLFLQTGTTTDGLYCEYDNVRVEEVVADRSYKAKPLAIVGTLAKTAVAAAAQLVAYSGFSASNYLQEAYSADLDPGTGAFRVSAWGSLPATLGDVFQKGAEQRGIGVTDAVGTITPATYNSGAGSGTVVRTDSSNQSFINFTGLTPNGWYWCSASNDAGSGGTLNFRQGGHTTTVAFSVVQGQTTGGRVRASSTGQITVTTAVGTTSFTNLTIKEEGPAIAFDRSAAAGSYYRFGVKPDGTLVAEVHDGTTTRTVTTTAAYNTGQFFKAAMHYDGAGKLSILVNGREVASTSGAALLTLNNASAVCTVGNRRQLDAAWPGSLALVKVSMTVPSAEASAWMYEQEKQMFSDGAQVTLPDAGSIVDIDYDRDTDQVLVASAANESAFNGLVRTATAAAKAGSIAKVAAAGGAKLIARTGTLSGVDVTLPPMNLKEQLVRRAEDAARAGRVTRVFDFDATASQTEFPLPVGFEAVEVIAAGASKREGSTKDWQRKFDGFKETVSFNTGQAAGTWVQATARRSA